MPPALMAGIGIATSLASTGFGMAGASAQGNASTAQAIAHSADREAARQAAIMEFEKLDIDISARTRAAGEILGLANAAVAGAGAEVSSGLTAQARALTLTGLARDIEVMRLNTDVATTRLGFGPSVGGPKGEKAFENKRKDEEHKAIVDRVERKGLGALG